MNWRCNFLTAAMISAIVLAASSTAWADDFDIAINNISAGDYVNGMRELNELAAAGDPRAEFKLGRLFQQGEGVPHDSDQALKWITRAADHGLVSAEFQLGYMYDRGADAPRQPALAEKWYGLAADSGFPGATQNLAILKSRESVEPAVNSFSQSRTIEAEPPGANAVPNSPTIAPTRQLPSPPKTSPSGNLSVQNQKQPASTQKQNRMDYSGRSSIPPATSEPSQGSPLSTIIVIGVIGWIVIKMRSSGKKKRATVVPQSRQATNLRSTAQTLPANSRSTRLPSRQPIISASTKTVAIWYPKGSAPSVAGIVLTGGMIYVGKIPDFGPARNSVIDAKLPVGPASQEQGAAIGYWPSYGSISQSNRLAYLTWLSTGRSNPNVDVGLVFLYFYGLEYRLLMDVPSAEERTDLTAEVVRLKGIYGIHGSFEDYSRRLLEAIQVLDMLADQRAIQEFKPDLQSSPALMPFPVKLAIATKVGKAQPLDFELAMAGFLGLKKDTATFPYSTFRHIRDEFLDMLRAQFPQRFPEGFLLRDRKDSKLQLQYRGAALGLQVDLLAGRKSPSLPDPETLTWTKFKDFVKELAIEMEPYAKASAHHPQRLKSLMAISLCPPGFNAAAVQDARNWIEGLPKPVAEVRYADLAQYAIGEIGAKWTLRHHHMIAEALAGMRYGLEPDPRDGSVSLTDDSAVFVFSESDPIAATSPLYGRALAGALVISSIARATGPRQKDIEAAWLAIAGEQLQVGPSALVRLQAKLRWMSTKHSGASKGSQKLNALSPSDKEMVARSVVSAVVRAGAVQPEQIATLALLYDRLHIPSRSLYTLLHNDMAGMTSAASEPIVVTQEEAAPLHAIPVKPAVLHTGLDLEKIRRVKADTDRVASVLAEIFSEEEADIPVEAKEGSNGFSNLDPSLSELIKRLLENASWSRADFEAEARNRELMPDGSLEAINEWSYDQFDDALLEDGDPIIVNATVASRIVELQGAPEHVSQ